MNNLMRTGLIIGLLSIVAYSVYMIISSKKVNEYKIYIYDHRTDKDIWYGSNFDSPFLKTNTPFHRLSYFEPDMDYLVKASFSKAETSDSVKLVTSTGDVETYLIYGEAKFTVKKKACSLQLLFIPGEKNLFLPFIDATSGKSTYGAGRYLEPHMPEGDEIILDFNLAYNPYCAYVDDYSCPFPPKSNVLEVAIEAGEKSYTH
jgi:uncharacterized protein